MDYRNVAVLIPCFNEGEAISQVVHGFKNALPEAPIYVCDNCSYHYRLGCDEYIKLLIDNNEYIEFEKDVRSSDPLSFSSYKTYKEQIEHYENKTGLSSAIKTVTGKINNKNAVLGVMDFSFIGGSMGSVVGHKIACAIDKANDERLPLVIVTASGGARMQEGAYSLMQLAKFSS